MNLSLTVATDLVPGFFQFLQCGIQMKAQVGCSIGSFLSEQLGLTDEFIEHQLKTIFLEGKPVDDIDSATIRDGSTLALSAAMPGLVGATMRIGSYYAPLRSGISHREKESISRKEGTVILKLFNLVALELGPVLLDRGISIRKEDLEDFFKRRSADFRLKCRAAALDGEEIDMDSLLGMKWSDHLPDRVSVMQLRVSAARC